MPAEKNRPLSPEEAPDTARVYKEPGPKPNAEWAGWTMKRERPRAGGTKCWMPSAISMRLVSSMRTMSSIWLVVR